jgi:hypothetical protein
VHRRKTLARGLVADPLPEEEPVEQGDGEEAARESA